MRGGYMKSLIIALALTIGATVWGAEDDLYNFLWLDPDKKVYVLQNKIYHKQGSLYTNIGYLSGLNSTYQDAQGAQMALGFYPLEEWAIELFYHKYHNSDNEDKKNLQAIGDGAGNPIFPFIRKFNSKLGAAILWSPFYGKINTFNQIIYLDWSFGLGGGKVQAQSNAKTVAADIRREIYEDESFALITAKAALRVYINKHFHTGIEYYRDMYQAGGPVIPGEAGPDKKLRINNEFVFNIGFNF